MPNPYARFSRSDMILRDHLAAARTVVANERTFLAYMRTALSVVAAGAAFIRFAESAAGQWFGWACMPAGAACLVFGVYRYQRLRQYIDRMSAGGPRA